jgi:thiol-disulfide isomerase/thioredoxin
MKRTLFTLLTAFFSTLAFAQTAPDFTFTDIEGVEHTLSEAQAEGKVILLDFFFVNCGPCQYWAPEVDQLLEDYEGTTLEVWSISDRDSDAYIGQSMFNPTHENHKVGGVAGNGDDIVSLYANNFSFLGFPTFAVICTDNSITWDIWPLSAGIPEIRSLLTEACGVVTVSAVKNIESLEMAKVFPNPAQEAASLSFSLSQATQLSIEVFNTLGQRVQYIASTEYMPGTHQLDLELSQLNNGLYIVQMQSPNGVQSLELAISK